MRGAFATDGGGGSMSISAALRRRSLALYRNILRTARTWPGPQEVSKLLLFMVSRGKLVHFAGNERLVSDAGEAVHS